MNVLAMPRLGETVTEGTVVKWLKNIGETVERDEMIVEISTDKVDTEIPSPVAGRVEEILVPEGKKCNVGTELAIIAAPGETEKRSETGAVPAAGEEKSARRLISPIVQKLAREHQVDLEQVEGTGHHGRITKKDIQAYIAAAPAPAKPAREEAPAKPAHEEAPAKPAHEEAPAPRVAAEREEVVPLSQMRKVIAERMTRSLKTAAHVTAMIEVDMEPIVRDRNARKQGVMEHEGFPLTYLPFLARAVIETLGRWPTLNATLDGDNLILKKYINLGIAVSVPNGLVVPVIRDAENLNILGLARAIHDLADRARSGHLNADEMSGGSFTITNPGSFGSVMQTPIINPPEVAILSFDAITKKPVVVDDAIAIRHMVTLSLSYDHRVNDGAIAAKFLSDLKGKLEAADFGDELLSA
jgi:2-oxoglutarate dehydrogenase complex dihydrolipoamide succinyltransferase (E2) component